MKILVKHDYVKKIIQLKELYDKSLELLSHNVDFFPPITWEDCTLWPPCGLVDLVANLDQIHGNRNKKPLL